MWKLLKDKNGYAKIIGGLIALLLVIIVGVMVYWETQGSIDEFGTVTEVFTGYSHGDNASAQTVTLSNSPNSASDVNVTCYSSTSGTLSYPTFSVNQKLITIAAGSASNYTQINVTYTSHIGAGEDAASDMAGTVFGLLPIVALVVVASIIIGVIIGFGGSNRRGL